MPTFRLTLEYDGEGFAGWQVQRGPVRTVQGTLEGAFQRVTGQSVRVIGAGRTDAGVHATGQVAGVGVDTALGEAALARALNGVLPADLAVLGAERVHDDFHAQHDARSKLYRYRIWNGPEASPLRARTHLRATAALDLEVMGEAAGSLLGSHDFACFQAAGSSVTTTLRTLLRCEIAGEAGGEIVLWVEGDGFLRHMVRNVVGTLLEVGRGRRAADSIRVLLAGRDRRAAGPTAPAHGLTLIRVSY